jgi:hypothetical protein
MGDLKDRADSAKHSALAAVAAHQEAVAEVRQAKDENEHARMLADAASEVLELARQETRAVRASAAEYADAAPRASPEELAQLEAGANEDGSESDLGGGSSSAGSPGTRAHEESVRLATLQGEHWLQAQKQSTVACLRFTGPF